MSTRGAPQTIAAGELEARCLELMDRVASTGRPITITKRGAPVAKLVPIVERPTTLLGFFPRSRSTVTSPSRSVTPRIT